MNNRWFMSWIRKTHWIRRIATGLNACGRVGLVRQYPIEAAAGADGRTNPYLEHLDKGYGEVEVGLIGEDEGAAEEDGDWENRSREDFTCHMDLLCCI